MMNYFTELDAADQNLLYQALVNQVTPTLEAEKVERERLQAEFNEATAAERELYEAAVKSDYDRAQEGYNVIKAATDKKVAEITKRFNKLVDKEVKKLAEEQAALQKTFDDATRPQMTAYQSAITPQKEIYEAKLTNLGAQVQELIKPINEEYYALAAQLDARQNQSMRPMH